MRLISKKKKESIKIQNGADTNKIISLAFNKREGSRRMTSEKSSSSALRTYSEQTYIRFPAESQNTGACAGQSPVSRRTGHLKPFPSESASALIIGMMENMT